MSYVKKICPICALVSVTWIILLAARYFGYNVNESLIALLMGGSAVGISYVLAGKIGSESARSGLSAKSWKLVSIPIAFLAAWQLLHYHLGWFALAVLAYVLIFRAFKGLALRDPKGEALGPGSKVSQIERELDNCCG